MIISYKEFSGGNIGRKMLKELDELVNKGYLRKFIDGNLVGYNYTDKCTFEKYWDGFTLNHRGTVYNLSTQKKVCPALFRKMAWKCRRSVCSDLFCSYRRLKSVKLIIT